MEPSDALHALRTLRDSFYDECLHRRADALFELTDALLTADTAPSPVHRSLQAPHRRGWGSLYAALWRGRIDAEALRGLLARHPLAGGGERPPVYAVDVSVWPRCDAEASPERGYYYHPSRHSAGQPIVAGWAYQFIARLNFVRESWTAPVGVERVRPAQDTNGVAAEQVKAFLRRSPEEGVAPLFVFDAGYDPVKLQQGLEESSPCQILVRLRAGRSFYADPSLSGPPALTGRPRRHGPRMKCAEPEHLARPLYGAHLRGRRLRSGTRAILEGVASEGPGARRAGQPRAFAHSARDAGSGGGRAAASWRETARAAGFVAVVGRPRGDRAGSRLALARLRETLRGCAGTHLSLPQANVWMEQPAVSPPRAGGSVDVARGVAAFTQLRLARTNVADMRLPWERRYEEGQLTTPTRVHRVISALLGQVGTSAKPPTSPCGRSPGRPKGRRSGRAQLYPTIKKSA